MEIIQEQTKLVSERLRKRAELLRINSFVILAMIIASIIGGGMFFLSEGELSANEAAERITSINRAYTNQIEELMIQRGRLQERYYKEIETGVGPQAEILRSDLDSIDKQLELLRSQFSDAAKNTSDQSSVSITALVTRTGSVVLLLFLVQILVTLYKYNTRLSEYCDAKADALELLTNGGITSLEFLSQIFSPENLDFGKAPSSPADQAVELAKQILSSNKVGNNG